MMLVGGHLIYFVENMNVVYFKERKNGRNGDIQNCSIEGDFAISSHWEFAIKS
jgi:hypothetical protein